MQVLDYKTGLEHLAETLKHFACNRSPQDKKEFHLKENQYYGKDVWRLFDNKSLDYAFIYT